MSSFTLLNDQPIGEGNPEDYEGLGFKTYSQILGKAILNTETPFTIGIFGEWGTGKTSLMRMVKAYIENLEKNNAIIVWFNAWKYEREEHPIVPLVAYIVLELERQQTFIKGLKDHGKQLIRSLRAVAYGISAKAKVNVPGFAEIEAAFVAKDMIDRADRLTPDPLLEKSLYYEAFEILSKLDIPKNKRIVVIIDDLDRCFPDTAIKLLESIKLVLSQKGFTFIIGVSRYVIEGYLQHRYETDYGLKGFDGRSYLDKIVQLPFYIPPHGGRIKNFSTGILSRIDEESRQGLSGVIDIINSVCNNNPRTTIRFINNLLIDQAINKALVAEREFYREIEIGHFAISRSLQQNWNEVFIKLMNSTKLCEKINNWRNEQEIENSIDKLDKETKELADLLLADKNLRNLLLSPAGKSWLKDANLRIATTEFLQTRRVDPESAITTIRCPYCQASLEDTILSIAKSQETSKEQLLTNLECPVCKRKINLWSLILDLNFGRSSGEVVSSYYMQNIRSFIKKRNLHYLKNQVLADQGTDKLFQEEIKPQKKSTPKKSKLKTSNK